MQRAWEQHSNTGFWYILNEKEPGSLKKWFDSKAGAQIGQGVWTVFSDQKGRKSLNNEGTHQKNKGANLKILLLVLLGMNWASK